MTTTRLEAFSDGVLAIIITILILELKIPEEASLHALTPLLPKFLSYVLSFLYVGIYWNNHHHLFQKIKEVDGKILWANLHLLFWLSLLPFATGWMGENHFGRNPVVLYGFVLLMCGAAFFLLEKAAIAHQGEGSPLKAAVGNHGKEIFSVVAYLTGIAASFLLPLAGIAVFSAVALAWFIPDRRIEKK